MRSLKLKYLFGVIVCASFLVAAILVNKRYKLFACHLFVDSTSLPIEDVKIMTWNVHCPKGTDSLRQHRLADFILLEDADFVLLNEYYQDSCCLMDSLLRTKYSYTEEYQSHRVCGDIFYSKKRMSNSGHPILRNVWKSRLAVQGETFPDSLKGKIIQAIQATIPVGLDSITILGMHWMSNSGDGSAIVDGIDSLKRIGAFYDKYKKAQENRCFQSFWTKELILDLPHPVIAMGDMNDFNCSAPLETLTGIGLKDAWWEGGFGYGCTFHTGWMRLRIDHILYSPQLKLQNVKVIDTDLSDHNPIVASFCLQ